VGDRSPPIWAIARITIMIADTVVTATPAIVIGLLAKLNIRAS
jgi:hypothetical protein